MRILLIGLLLIFVYLNIQWFILAVFISLLLVAWQITVFVGLSYATGLFCSIVFVMDEGIVIVKGKEFGEVVSGVLYIRNCVLCLLDATTETMLLLHFSAFSPFEITATEIPKCRVTSYGLIESAEVHGLMQNNRTGWEIKFYGRFPQAESTYRILNNICFIMDNNLHTPFPQSLKFTDEIINYTQGYSFQYMHVRVNLSLPSLYCQPMEERRQPWCEVFDKLRVVEYELHNVNFYKALSTGLW